MGGGNSKGSAGGRRVVVVVGPPASGKGTVCQHLCKQMGVPQLSTGDMLRAAVELKSKEGLEAGAIMERGGMVPDKVVNAILEARIGEGDCDKGFVLDGYPRTLSQAKSLEKMLSKAGDRVETVAVLDVPFKVLEDRVAGRWIHFSSGRSYHVAYKPPKSLVEAREQAGPNVEPTAENMMDDETGEPLGQRPDDTPNAIKTRIAKYKSNADPIYRRFGKRQGVLRRVAVVEADTPDSVWGKVQAALA